MEVEMNKYVIQTFIYGKLNNDTSKINNLQAKTLNYKKWLFEFVCSFSKTLI